jgi:hypothetical protein
MCGAMYYIYVPVEEWERSDGKNNVLFFQICSVHVGQLVWARHKNRRYYKGQITNISEIQFYMVLFSDGSFSDDLCPQDIKVSLWLEYRNS